MIYRSCVDCKGKHTGVILASCDDCIGDGETTCGSCGEPCDTDNVIAGTAYHAECLSEEEQGAYVFTETNVIPFPSIEDDERVVNLWLDRAVRDIDTYGAEVNA